MVDRQSDQNFNAALTYERSFLYVEREETS